MEEIQFVNIHGHRVVTEPTDPAAPKRKAKPEAESFHKGFKVQGIPPGALEDARAEHARLALLARESGKAAKDWDEGNWLMNAKRKPVRSKPYEIESSARQCAELAERAGWLRVEVVEIKKEPA